MSNFDLFDLFEELDKLDKFYYNFVTEADFQQEIAGDQMLQHAPVDYKGQPMDKIEGKKC